MAGKIMITGLVILLGGGQLTAYGQEKNTTVINKPIIVKNTSASTFEIPDYDLEKMRKQEQKWKCSSLDLDRSAGRWGLVLLLAAIGGAIAGAVIAGTHDSHDNHVPLPLLPRGPLKGKFSK